MNQSKSLVLAALILPLAASSLAAHDMWIEPVPAQPKPGAVIALRLRVGQQLLGDPLARSAQLIKEFVVEDSTGRRLVVVREGSNPAGLALITQPAVVLYASNPSRVEQPPAKFDAYLSEEGLEAIAAERARRGESHTTAREHFSRCAKALIPIDGATADRAMGCTLELVAEADAATAANLPLRLIYNGKPLAGALVVAINRADPMHPHRQRTGRDGRVRFALPANGLWLIKAVHMVRAQPGVGVDDVDWASYWASLTFEHQPPAASANGGH